VRRLVPMLAALSSIATGCGGGGGNDSQTENAFNVKATRVAITLRDFRIEPAKITLRKPGVYTFVAKNEGSVTHVFEVESNDLENETSEIPPGGTAELTIRLHANRYKTYCPLDHHEQKGMHGTMVVASAPS